MKDTKRIVLEFAGYRLESAALHAANDAPRIFKNLRDRVDASVKMHIEEWDDKAKRWKLVSE